MSRGGLPPRRGKIYVKKKLVRPEGPPSPGASIQDNKDCWEGKVEKEHKGGT